MVQIIRKIMIIAAALAVVFLGSYTVLYFPEGLVLDLFWTKAGPADIGANYVQHAGLPAGEGIPVLNTIEQFRDEALVGCYTFETDSIIPIDGYRLESDRDRLNTDYNAGWRTRRTGLKQLNVFTKTKGIKGELYNRYYLVRLPDGHYVEAFLDDSYYARYLLGGKRKVQLPIGVVKRLENQEKELFEPYGQKYGLGLERKLVMFSGRRYEKYELLYWAVRIGAALCLAILIFALLIAGDRLLKKLEARKA